MNAYICPKGHASTEADYCSECGARIEGAAPPADQLRVPQALPDSENVCPECGAPREPSDVVFCEICGFNFVTGARGELPVRVPAPPVPPPEETAPTVDSLPPEIPPAASGWKVIVSVNPALREPGSPEVPVGLGPFTFVLNAPASLIGRRSEARAIFPEIALSWDDAVSHRHALLQVDPAGELLLRDIGSANGTRLNGAEVPPMTDQRLADGDQIALGHWTCILVKATPEE